MLLGAKNVYHIYIVQLFLALFALFYMFRFDGKLHFVVGVLVLPSAIHQLKYIIPEMKTKKKTGQI